MKCSSFDFSLDRVSLFAEPAAPDENKTRSGDEASSLKTPLADCHLTTDGELKATRLIETCRF